MYDAQAAEIAIEEFNGRYFNGRLISVILYVPDTNAAENNRSTLVQAEKNGFILVKSEENGFIPVKVEDALENPLPSSPLEQIGTQGDFALLSDTSMSGYIVVPIMESWKPVSTSNQTPWRNAAIQAGTAKTDGLHRLHDEAYALDEYVKPTAVSQAVRTDVVGRLYQTARKADSRLTHVHCFGSVATGLFLPSGDIDVVARSYEFVYGHKALSDSDIRGILYRLQRQIHSDNLVDMGDKVEVVANARVPIVKFFEERTGLSVDISFDNNSGLNAVEKVKEWIEQFPYLPTLVRILKQFLHMRGMDEPKNGFMGGLTVVCLVVNYLRFTQQQEVLQEMPYADASRDCYLALLVLKIFYYYGKVFDPATTGIHMSKGEFSKFDGIPTYEIIWPFKNANSNIAYSTTKGHAIKATFAEAYETLNAKIDKFNKFKTMAERGNTVNLKMTVLGSILAGNYDVYAQQLATNQKVYANMIQRGKGIKSEE